MTAPSPPFERIAALFFLLVLGKLFLFDPLNQTTYWILKDGQQGTGVITLERDHGVVSYAYR